MNHLAPRFVHLKREYDAVAQCNRCGFCETACPTYVASGKENLSPRGRNQMFRRLLEGNLSRPEQASEIFSTCLTCHACTNVCFSEVPVGRLMGYARELSQEPFLKSPAIKSVMRLLFTHREILSALMWFAFLAKRLKISAFLKKIGWLKLLSPELSQAEELVEQAPLKFGAQYIRRTGTGPTAAYFSGCGTRYLYPSADESCLKVLERSGDNLAAPSHPCCGLMLFSAGDSEGAQKLALKNLALFRHIGPETIVVNDDSCCGFMKDYPRLLDKLAPEQELTEFAGKVTNLSGRWRHNPHLSPATQSPAVTVTYHDPCQMGNAHKITAAPRDLLKSMPNVRYVELEEANWCCGGAGTFCLKHPALADEVLERKLINIQKSGAEIVITQAASCLMHISYGLRKKKWNPKVRILHLAEFLNGKFGSKK